MGVILSRIITKWTKFWTECFFAITYLYSGIILLSVFLGLYLGNSINVYSSGLSPEKKIERGDFRKMRCQCCEPVMPQARAPGTLGSRGHAP